MAVAILFAVFVTGACIGSFINVLVLRLPHPTESFLTARSHCFSCRRHISPYDLVPIISWFILRGRCRYCQAPFSFRYVVVELLIACLATFLWLNLGLSFQFFELFLFCSTLIVIGLIDLDTWLIPVSLPVFLMITGLMCGYQDPFRIAGWLFGFTLLALVLVIGTWILRRRGRLQANETAMGWGDPLLLGAIGAYLGIQALPFTILLSSLQALLLYAFFSWKRQAPKDDTWVPPDRALPFGPFLALAAIEQVLWQVIL